LTNTNDDIFYVKGPLLKNGGITYYSIYHNDYDWRSGSRYGGSFTVDPYHSPLDHTGYLFGTNGQPLNIVQHPVV
jgi:hypothetical protein